jgi:hypothetical protein
LTVLLELLLNFFYKGFRCTRVAIYKCQKEERKKVNRDNKWAGSKFEIINMNDSKNKKVETVPKKWVKILVVRRDTCLS